MNEKAFRVTVFGKAGCEKCRVLNKRLDELFAKPEWSEFEKVYCDVETEDGLVPFCRAECISPNRVPAMLVARWNPERSLYENMPTSCPDKEDPVLKKSRLYSYLGLQTDYSATGQGVITPKMLTSLLQEARSAAS